MHTQAHRQARPAYALQQRVDVVEGGLRGAVGVLRLVPQHPQQAAEFGEGLTAGGADGLQRLGGALRTTGSGVRATVGQARDDGEVVADDVVHLPGDPGPFGGGGEAGLLVALAFQPVGPVDEGLRVLLARTHQDAREGGDGEHPDVREQQPVPVVREPHRGSYQGGGEQRAGPGQGAHRESYGDVEDHDLLEQRRLDGRAGPYVDEGERGHEGQHEQRVGAAPQQRCGERHAHREHQWPRHVRVDGDRAPAAGGDVEDGEQHPARGEGAVPDGRPAAVEGAYALEQAL